MESAESGSKTEAQNEIVPEEGSMVYMTENELTKFLDDRKDLELSQEEREYLFLRRRRLSLEMKHGTQEDSERLQDVSNVLKVMVLGDEFSSGKTDVFRSLGSLAYDSQWREGSDVPFLSKLRRPCLIHRFDVPEPVREQFEHSPEMVDAIELWLPDGASRFDAVRAQFYLAVDVFVLVFSVKSIRSFEEITTRWMEEVKIFASTQPRRAFPVILVGYNAEARTVGANPSTSLEGVVPANDVVEFARKQGVVKYVEMFSDNLAHSKELFKQILDVSLEARESNTAMSRVNFIEQFMREDSILRRYLTCDLPTVEFDLPSHSIVIEVPEDVSVLYDLHGGSPSLESPEYEGPIKLSKPTPSEVKVMAIARGRYPSAIVTFQIPSETRVPCGHVDVVGRQFILKKESDVEYYYTLDGSTPTPYPTEWCPTCPPNGIIPLSGNSEHPLQIVAIGANMFPSAIATFSVPRMLPAPTIHFDELSNILTIGPQTGRVEYHYTLDGTDPFTSSTAKLYTSPIMLAGWVDSVRVAPFPKMFLAGKPTTFKLRARGPSVHEGHKFPSVRMTTASLKRQELVRKTPEKTSPHATPTPKKRRDAPIASLAEPSIPVRMRSSIRSARTREETLQDIRKKSLAQYYGSECAKHSSSHKASSTTTPSRGPASPLPVAMSGGGESARVPASPSTEEQSGQLTGRAVTCRREGNSLIFRFTKLVSLERVDVVTPGHGAGPDGVELVLIRTSGARVSLGNGKLDDFQGPQEIGLTKEDGESVAHKVAGLECIFESSNPDGRFHLDEVKLFGKVLS